MIKTKAYGVLLIPFMFIACVASGGAKTLDEQHVVAKVTLDEDVLVYFGSLSKAEFTLLTPLLENCEVARIRAYARNPSENFRIPSSEASLRHDLDCFFCETKDGQKRTYAVEGVLKGPELRGQYTHIRGAKGFGDRFGLSLRAGAQGELIIESLTERNCVGDMQESL